MVQDKDWVTPPTKCKFCTKYCKKEPIQKTPTYANETKADKTFAVQYQTTEIVNKNYAA